MKNREPKPFDVGVFVRRGNRGWLFEAYTRYFAEGWDEGWDGCNVVCVTAVNSTEAKQKAIAVVKARMNLKSQLAPSNVKVAKPGS